MESLLNKLVSIEFSDRKKSIRGYLLAFTEDWLLLEHNVIDYLLDGYVFINRSHVALCEQTDKEIWVEKVIRWKGTTITTAPPIPMTNIETILRYLTEHFGFFSIEQRSDQYMYVGKWATGTQKQFVIDWLKPRAVWDGQQRVNKASVRVIGFGSDYLAALQAALHHQSL